MTRLSLLAAAALALALPAQAAPPTKAELLQTASKVVEACANTMPDFKATTKALSDLGLGFYESNGQLQFHTLEGFRIVTAVTMLPAQIDGCMIVVSRMTPAEAQAVVTPWIKAIGAGDAQPAPDGGGQFWVGKRGGKEYRIGIADHMELEVVRGSAIIVGARKD